MQTVRNITDNAQYVFEKALNEVDEFQALASKSRLEILKLLQKKPLSIEEISNITGLSATSVRQHLQTLEGVGFIELHEKRIGTSGRPKGYYKFAIKEQFVGYPKRGYLGFSKLLMTILQSSIGLDRTKEMLRKVGVERGEHALKELELKNEIREWSLKKFEDFYINKYLKESGEEPEIVEVSDKKIIYRVHNCVFFELARVWPDMICESFHEGVHEGISNVTGKRVKISRLRCMAKGAPYCEHVCEWLADAENIE